MKREINKKKYFISFFFQIEIKTTQPTSKELHQQQKASQFAYGTRIAQTYNRIFCIRLNSGSLNIYNEIACA